MTFQPTYMQHVYSGFEPSQAFDVIYGTSFEHRLLSAQFSTMKHQRLLVGDLRLETGGYDFPVIAHGSMPKAGICIGFVAQGAECARYNTRQIGPDEIQIYPEGVELLYHAAGSSRWITFVVPEDKLQSTAVSQIGRPLEITRSSPYSIQLPAGGRSALTTLVDDTFALARRLHPVGGLSSDLAEEIYNTLLASYVDALCTSTPAYPSKRSSTEQRHYHLIAACERLVLRGVEADVALSDIAKRSGYSLRSLELIFRRGVGMTPGRWFMTARLNGALRDLMAGDESCTVSEVASKWGFRHMSRFAEYYRYAFGESPRDTLRRPWVS